MKLCTVALVVSLCSFAADQAWFRLLGFAGDGRFMAWEEGGVHDGSGFPWLRIVVLDTETSTEVESSYKVWEDELEEPGEGFFEGDRTSLLMEFGIDTPPEEPLVYRPLTDLTLQGDSIRFCIDYYCPGYWEREHTLRLEQHSAGYRKGYPLWFPEPVTLSVTLSGDVFFQEDYPQAEYEFVYGYGVAGIYLNPCVSNRLIVVLHSVVPGFEGADGRFRVVSGVLP